MTDAPTRLFPATPARLGTWLDCPRMYRFRYVDRPAPRQEPPTAEQSWGNTIHAALRAWLDLSPDRRQPDALALLVNEHWVAAGWRDGVQQQQWKQAALAALERYAGTDAGRVPVPVAAERTVAATYGGMALSGRVDRVDERDGELVVVDYKTGRRPPTTDDARGSLALAVYAYAAWRTLRRRCLRVELHHVPTCTVAAHEHTEDTLRRHLDRADAVAAEARDATDHPPRPGPLCPTCPYLRSCEAGLTHVGGVIREPWESIERREPLCHS